MIIQKRGIWGGYEIHKVGTGKRAYFWFGEIKGKYLLALTVKQARKVAKLLK